MRGLVNQKISPSSYKLDPAIIAGFERTEAKRATQTMTIQQLAELIDKQNEAQKLTVFRCTNGVP